MNRIELIQQQLTTALSPTYLELVDESEQHSSHGGAKQGGHFNLIIVSEKFAEQPLVQRHRQVYAALADLMQNEVHAISIKAYTPTEYQNFHN
jgi:BolA family transcriptional regulator, general stress-responsive regulator